MLPPGPVSGQAGSRLPSMHAIHWGASPAVFAIYTKFGRNKHPMRTLCVASTMNCIIGSVRCLRSFSNQGFQGPGTMHVASHSTGSVSESPL